VRKLNGIVYTPDALAEAIVARLPLRPDAAVLDPACGNGVFLAAVARRAEREGIPVVIEGWDIDAAALAEAEGRLGPGRCRLVHRDALDPEERRFDLVVGNPPYLEAKRMPDAAKRRLREICPVAATGAFDLYAAFVERGAQLLRDDGSLAFLVPNRLAVTANAARLRSWLLDRGEVSLVDLSRSDVFPDAAVYPIVLGLRCGAPPALACETLTGTERTVLDAATVRTILGGRWPLPDSPEAARLVRRVLDGGLPPLSARYEVRWTVSFHASGRRDRYVFAERPDSPHARRFLGGGRFAGNREVEPCAITWAGAWIDYDEARASAESNPLPPAELFEAPKVAICQNARRARAAVDTAGFVLKDTFLLARPRDPTDAAALYWLPLVLHSDVFHVLYEAMYGGTRKGGGFLHFLAGYLEPFPVPPPPPDLDVVALYRACAAEGPDVAEAVVRRAYGVTADEARWLATFALPAS
jgi:SAM-dependent methyltransferase